MAKNSITDFDNTAANNTDIQSVNIDENCPASGINNAIRELMADLADVNDGTVALESPKFDSIKDGNIQPPDASGTDVAGTATTIKGGAGTGTGAGGSIVFQTADGGSTGSSVNAHATAMTITDDGNVNFTGSIKDSTGTNTALTIDSSGRVLTPARPVFCATRYSADGSVVGDATAIQWANVLVNQGNHFNNTTGIWTCPVDGIYSVCLNLNLKDTNTDWMAAYVYQNTLVKGYSWSRNNTEFQYDNAIVSLFLDCSANDEILCGYNDGYSAPSTANHYNHIAISLVG